MYMKYFIGIHQTCISCVLHTQRLFNTFLKLEYCLFRWDECVTDTCVEVFCPIRIFSHLLCDDSLWNSPKSRFVSNVQSTNTIQRMQFWIWKQDSTLCVDVRLNTSFQCWSELCVAKYNSNCLRSIPFGFQPINRPIPSNNVPATRAHVFKRPFQHICG